MNGTKKVGLLAGMLESQNPGFCALSNLLSHHMFVTF
jgi:hypothetical protein